jgi:hypothetical protein
VPDYSPYAAQLYPDEVSRSASEVQFRDVHRLATFPVDETRLSSARLTLTTYRPAAHFTRDVVIDQIQPRDWATPR